MRILKYILWNLHKTRIEQELKKFCTLEYKHSDVEWAYNKSIKEYKAGYLNA